MTSLNSSYYTAINTQHEKLGFDFFRPKNSSVPPTVLQVLPALNSGGVERGTLEISDALIALWQLGVTMQLQETVSFTFAWVL